MIRETGHLPAGNRRVARTQHDPTTLEIRMTEQPAPWPAATPEPSIRPVIEHALIDYGYRPDTAAALIDQLIAEEGDQ